MLKSGLPAESLSRLQREQLKLSAHAALARQDFLAYATFIDPAYLTPKHVQLLGAYLHAIERGEITRLAIILPPRHSKSESTSGKFPGWCIGRDPKRPVMITSYAATLAETFSVQNRDTIMTNPRWNMVFPDVVINPNSRGRDRWAVMGARESCIAAGVGGSITGLGCWLLLIDDPVKNYEEATSEARLESIYNWYSTTARTRLTPDGRVIIIMTRWSEDDLLGRVFKEHADEFTVLHLPALSYGVEKEYVELYPDPLKRIKVLGGLPKTAFPDPLGRPRGEPLWPERFNKEFLEQQRLILGHDFEALYQGNPSAPEGKKFKRDWFRPITPAIIAALQAKPVAQRSSWDLAWSSRERADFTVGLRATLYQWDKTAEVLDDATKSYLKLVNIPPVFLVIEKMRRWQKEWDDDNPKLSGSESLIETALDDTDKYTLLIEAIASQNVGFKGVRNDKRMTFHDVLPVTKQVDKEVNAKYALRLGGRGLVFLLYENATTPPVWEKDFLNELGSFPTGANDDIVDAYAQLANNLQPLITSRLRDAETVGRWHNPFGSPQQATGFVRKLPPEFQPVDAGKWQRDRLGWA